jgi:hypothetical protein
LLKKLDKSSKLGGLKNMAIIFNGVKSRGIGKYGYEYGYGNSNGSGYAEAERKEKRERKKKDVV